MSEIKLNYHKTHFLTSAPNIRSIPEDTGIEIAFAARSNAGKSTALNALTNQKSLARTSKTPGRTQLINLFEVEPNCKLVDLPGYGYAAVPEKMKMISRGRGIFFGRCQIDEKANGDEIIKHYKSEFQKYTSIRIIGPAEKMLETNDAEKLMELQTELDKISHRQEEALLEWEELSEQV